MKREVEDYRLKVNGQTAEHRVQPTRRMLRVIVAACSIPFPVL